MSMSNGGRSSAVRPGRPGRLDHRGGARQGRATALAMAREGVRIVALDVARPLDISRLRDGLGRRPRVAGRGVSRAGRRSA